MSIKLQNMLFAAIGVALCITSVQVSAQQSDNLMPREACFHIFPVPNHPDPEGSFIALRFHSTGAINLQNPITGKKERLRLRKANGIGIGRAPLRPPLPPFFSDAPDWFGTPLSGTCHPHDGKNVRNSKYQCSLQAISAITLRWDPPLLLNDMMTSIGSSIETGVGDITLVVDRKNDSITLSQVGTVDAAYFDTDGNFIPDNSPLLAGPPVLPTFRRFENFLKKPDIYEVDCRKVPHPKIPPFTIPMPPNKGSESLK